MPLNFCCEEYASLYVKNLTDKWCNGNGKIIQCTVFDIQFRICIVVVRGSRVMDSSFAIQNVLKIWPGQSLHLCP